VLDASALLAYLNDEAGAEVVEAALGQGCFISSVNLAKVFSKVAELGGKPSVLAQRLEQEGILHQTLEVVPFTLEDSFEVAALRVATKSLELSLGDCVCLTLGKKLGLPVLTADTLWKKLSPTGSVTIIR
jgi:PIN domain nuclease of toxin-antitoxin system